MQGTLIPMLNIQNLIDDAKCCETVRELRWPEFRSRVGMAPHSQSEQPHKVGRAHPTRLDIKDRLAGLTPDQIRCYLEQLEKSNPQ
jgi:hypothetical protein